MRAFFICSYFFCLLLYNANSLSTSTIASSSMYNSKIAVILNVNARSVSQSSISIAQSIMGKDNVFVTKNVEDNEDAARTIVERGYKMVVPGGGDGTLCSVINAIICARHKYLSNEELEGDSLPKFAFLPLGTGNGMGMLVGPRVRGRKSKKVETMLTRLKQIVEDCEKNQGALPTVKCPMIEIQTDKTVPKVKGDQSIDRELCFFAGAGFDSLMLNDFNVLKRWSRNKPGLGRFLGSVLGYTVALLVRTLPQCLIWGRHKISVRVTVPKPNIDAGNKSNKDSSYWIDHRRGDTAMEILPTNENKKSKFPTKVTEGRQLIFEGETGIVAAGTTPYYGGGLKLFPFSRVQPHHMHLRLGRINPILGFFNIPWIFRGSYRHYNMGCLDFLGSDFDVELSKPYPFQHSGEAIHEEVKRFVLKVADEEIEFVDFLKPRLVFGD